MKTKSFYLSTEAINLIKAVSFAENQTHSKVIEKAIKAYVNDKHKALAYLLQEEESK